MLRKKAITMTRGELSQHRQILADQDPTKYTDELGKAIMRTLRGFSAKHQDTIRDFQMLGRKYAVKENGKPKSIQPVMQQYHQELDKAEEKGEEPPEPPALSRLERETGFFIEDEEALREAEKNLVQEEVEVEIYMCAYEDAVGPGQTFGTLMQFDYLIDFESNGVQEPVVVRA